MQFADQESLTIKTRIMSNGKIITPNKSVKTGINITIEEIRILPKFDIKKGCAQFLFRQYKDTDVVKYPPKEGVPLFFLDKLEYADLVEYDNFTDSYYITKEGSHFIVAVKARLQTRRGVKSGTDLFPEAANIFVCSV